MMKPFVSILIPAFNAQDCIAETLRSAIAQTWERKEIVVVDDGSCDQTLAIARQFESDSLRVVTQKNQGAAAARNTAFSLSRGDYIQWLDADDLLSPNKIASQIDYALSHGASRRTLLSCAWGHFIHRSQCAQFVPTPLWCDLSPLEWLLRKMEHDVFMQTATWLVSRELTEATGPWNTQLLGDDDGEYFCRVLLASTGICFIPQARVYYRRSGSNSLSYVGLSDRKMEALFLSMQLHIGYLRSLEDNARVRAACVKFLQDSLLVFYPERPDIVEQAKQLAAALGGRLTMPLLSWKYSWIQKVFGWPAAKRAQIVMPRYKWSLIRSVDRTLSLIDKRHPRYEIATQR
jgi:glycosyltransferase involved in cell wall biosynthesis